MIVHQGYHDLRLHNPVVTLGIFDGVHLGHRYLLDILTARAREMNGESVVITFQPHPRLILERNTEGLSFLSTNKEKKRLLEKAGIDHLIIIRFTKKFSRIRACDFVRDILAGEIGTKYLILGHDHHFGYKGEGDYGTIESCAASSGFMVEQVPGYNSDRGLISSSMIRSALLKGNIEDANSWLGYSYSIRGTVVAGNRIGRILGYPTANIFPDDRFKLLPGDGVYAVEVKVERKIWQGMLSIGKNPTVNRFSSKRSIEVHIFGFDKNIYGKQIEIVFRFWLRNEKKYDTREHLARQLEADRKRAIMLLNKV